MNREKFMDYVRENFDVDGATQRLMDNILTYVELQGLPEDEQYNLLCMLLDGSIGLTDNEIKKIYL